VCANAHASWGEEVSSPRVGLLLAESTRKKFCPRHPHSTLCKLEYVVSLSLLDFCEIYNHGAHPLVVDATSGNARGSDANALDPVRLSTGGLPPVHAHISRRKTASFLDERI